MVSGRGRVNVGGVDKQEGQRHKCSSSIMRCQKVMFITEKSGSSNGSVIYPFISNKGINNKNS